MRKGFFSGKNVKIAISQHFEFFTFFILQIDVFVSQRICNSWGWNWSQMFTYSSYYPQLAITSFRSNGPFTYEMSHMVKEGNHYTTVEEIQCAVTSELKDMRSRIFWRLRKGSQIEQMSASDVTEIIGSCSTDSQWNRINSCSRLYRNADSSARNKSGDRVPGYSSIQQNKIADRLGREGARTRPIGPEPFLPQSSSRFKSEIRNWIKIKK